MEKTLFAGLTVLAPDESVMADSGAFTGRDRQTMDRLLEIGAKTHRHSGAAGLPNPTTPVVASVQPSGGAIRGDTTFTIAYSLEDSDNGETIVSDTTVVTTPPPLEFPTYNPSVAMDYADGGDLLVDTYYYTLTFVDSEGGETPSGPSIDIEREPGFPNARVLLTHLNDGVAAASAAAWRLYRAVGGGTFDYLASGTGSSYIDDGSVSVNCDLHPPADQEVNTTQSINTLRVVLPSAIGDAAFINLYASLASDFIGNTLIGTYPSASAGQTVFFDTYSPSPQSPPDVNLSIGGASQIDPDTELLDWHWKRPVATVGDLPVSAEHGDVRMVLDIDTPYEWNGSFWQPLAAGSAFIAPGGGTGSANVIGGLIHEEFNYPDGALADRLDGNWALVTDDAAVSVAGNAVVGTGAPTTGTVAIRTDALAVDQVVTQKFVKGASDTNPVLVLKADGPAGQRLLEVGAISGPGDFDVVGILGGGVDFLASIFSQPLVNGETYWFRAGIIVNTVFMEVYDEDPFASDAAPIADGEYELTGGQEDNWGQDVQGYAGAGWVPGGGEVWDDLWVQIINTRRVESDHFEFLGASGVTVDLEQGDNGAHRVRIGLASGAGGGGGSPAPAGITIIDGQGHTLTGVDSVRMPGASAEDLGGGAIHLLGGSIDVGSQERAIGPVGPGHDDTAVQSSGLDLRFNLAGHGEFDWDILAGGVVLGGHLYPGTAQVTLARKAGGPIGVVKDDSGGMWRNASGLVFKGSGETQVAVRNSSGPGSADITIFGAIGVKGSAAVFHAIDELEFSGAEVTPLGGGSARITITPTGGGTSSLQVKDADPTSVQPVSSIDFRSSGVVGVDVTDLGGGSARVLIGASAIAGAQGPAGASGAPGAPGASGAPGAPGAPGGGSSIPSFAAPSGGSPKVQDDAYTEYRASGGLSLDVSSLGTGSAAVTLALPGRRWTSAAISLASGASGNLDFAASAAGGRLLKISTSKRARVRAYGQSAKRTADLLRAIGTDPTGDHGVLLDYAATSAPSGMVGTISPAVDAHNLDEPPANTHYLNITNYDATGTVTVAFLILPTEVV